jgi:primosomal protein N''
MKFFGRDPMKKLEASVAALRQRAATLEQKRSAAQTAFDRALAERQAYAVSGDIDGAAADKDMARLQTLVDSASSALAGLDAALAEVTTQLTAAENELTAEREAGARLAASQKIAKDIARIEPQIAAWLAATCALAGELKKSFGLLRFDADALSGFLIGKVGEAEVAFAVLLQDLHGAVDNVREGREKLPADAAPAKPVVEVVPPAPVQTIFLLRPSKYLDPTTGKVVLLNRYEDADVSPALAERALRSRAAVPVTHEFRRRNKGTWLKRATVAFSFDLDAVDVSALPPLDAIEAQQAAEVIDVQEAPDYAEPPVARHTAFEKIDRGRPYTIIAPRGAAS